MSTTSDNDEQIQKRVTEIIRNMLGEKSGHASEITLESSFVQDLGADSLDTVELVMGLEDEFGIEIPDSEAEKITTVQEAVDYIKAHTPTSSDAN